MVGHAFICLTLCRLHTSNQTYAALSMNEREWVSVSVNVSEWSIEKKRREQVSWSVSRAPLKNQFLGLVQNYRPSKLEKYSFEEIAVLSMLFSLVVHIRSMRRIQIENFSHFIKSIQFVRFHKSLISLAFLTEQRHAHICFLSSIPISHAHSSSSLLSIAISSVLPPTQLIRTNQ